ncbi:histone deacetylase HDA1 ASCRUDRAFT_32334 [Ascoidea rubescens DSM 1968]|uniref:Histone deacetylase n=1 Tax=Ascoidea rubescens DSM 1968 TaxID=1344418 RepID=A0A1D2VM23_9ASCO|nr:hypothetical protein ASCRUDRAFT_32334 [Ascoidea rubescens DSM 1968]ODV62666.1 hypothetical protein ASCRUDRAFT_32334 [Ascoidea rubescens DSM 1968]
MTEAEPLFSETPLDQLHIGSKKRKLKSDEISSDNDQNNNVLSKIFNVNEQAIIVPSVSPKLSYTPLKTGFCYDVRMRYHAKLFTSYYEYIDPHPEDPRRIYRIYKILVENGLINDPSLSGNSDDFGELMVKIPVREATAEEILLVHSSDLFKFLESTQKMSKKDLLKETEKGDSIYFNHDSFTCAKLSCGGVIEACKAVVEGKVKNAFAIVRPPGHHAEPNSPGGFCLFSNVGVAAKNILRNYPESVRKIAIVDWDVHHGNGTQKCFYDNPNVLYISIHRYESGKYYPGTKAGDYDQCGEGLGEGFNVNIPWPITGMKDADYIYAFNKVVLPILFEFNPDLIIISSGFDAADGDLIGQCHVSPGCYGHMTDFLKTLAKGNLCVALEGGYNLNSISISALAVTKALIGEPPDLLQSTIPCVEAIETIYKVLKQQSKYWKCMRAGFGLINDITKLVPKINSHHAQSIYSNLQDAVRTHQANELHEKYGLINLPILFNDLGENKTVSSSTTYHVLSNTQFDDQILSTVDIYKEETIVMVVHDPAEVWGYIEPKFGNIELSSSVIVNPLNKLYNWIVTEKKYGLIDVCIPTSTIFLQSSNGLNNTNKNEQYSNVLYSQELMLYIWDNYLKFFKNLKNLVFFGIGESYAGIVHLLGHRLVVNTSFNNDVKPNNYRKNSTNNIRTIIPILDETLVDWFYRNSLIFTSNKHPVFDGDNDSNGNGHHHFGTGHSNRKLRKKFGRVIKSEHSDNITDVFNENCEEAIDFALETIEDYYSSEDGSGYTSSSSGFKDN